jgi:hypothetical protein
MGYNNSPQGSIPGHTIPGGVTMTLQERFETDVIPTSAGDLKVTFLGHGTLMLTFKSSPKLM